MKKQKLIIVIEYVEYVRIGCLKKVGLESVYIKEQIGGVTNDQRIFLNKELTSHINKLRQAEMQGDPPPAPAMMAEYNHEELEELLNKSNGEIIPGEIYINMDMFENDRVYGISRNSRNYIIFTNGNVDTIKSIREFIDQERIKEVML